MQKLYGAPKKVPAAIRFVDIAGLVPGASKGEGLGNKFLSHIRNVDAIAQVVRCFDDKDVVNVLGELEPRKDADIISTELLLADLEQAERLKEKVQGAARAGAEEARKTMELLSLIHVKLQEGTPVRRQGLDPAAIRDFNFLTAKPVLYVANVNEASNALAGEVRRFGAENGAEVVELNAKLEAEIMALAEEERASYRDALGMASTGLERLAMAGRRLLSLISFFAAGPKEVHAWHVRQGSTVAQAAGKIHSDMERGFIRAEVFSAEDLLNIGSEQELRTLGKIRMEGKDYITQDGDVLQIHFKV
jgi:GTP-binding protein YchF